MAVIVLVLIIILLAGILLLLGNASQETPEPAADQSAAQAPEAGVQAYTAAQKEHDSRTTAHIPADTTPPTPHFLPKDEFYSLAGDSWKYAIQSTETPWARKDGVLSCRVSDQQPAGLMTIKEWGSVALGVTCRITAPGSLTLVYHQRAGSAGRITLTDLTPGAWHTVQLKLVYNSKPQVIIDGRPIPLPGTTAELDHPAGLSSTGKLGITYSPTSGSATIYLAEFALKKLRAAIWIEAEAADELIPPMAIRSHNKASGGKYIVAPDGTGKGGPARAAYRFMVSEPGEYHIWARVMLPSGTADSFYITLDQGTRHEWWPSPNKSWQWKEVTSNAQKKSNVTFTLDPGEHTLYVDNREDGSCMDKLLLTNDNLFKPDGLGETGNKE